MYEIKPTYIVLWFFTIILIGLFSLSIAEPPQKEEETILTSTRQFITMFPPDNPCTKTKSTATVTDSHGNILSDCNGDALVDAVYLNGSTEWGFVGDDNDALWRKFQGTSWPRESEVSRVLQHEFARLLAIQKSQKAKHLK